ncbi:hypothetical protein [Neglectibacter sp. X4]|uniref:hypothetical protein n=1 Tax=Neglectibacter sp. X4 TaxID=2305472 RepID=UPI001412FB38|nr:hypothetical protein [Neglectibacter sp. X4]
MEPRSKAAREKAALLVGAQPHDGWVFAHPFLFSGSRGEAPVPAKPLAAWWRGVFPED